MAERSEHPRGTSAREFADRLVAAWPTLAHDVALKHIADAMQEARTMATRMQEAKVESQRILLERAERALKRAGFVDHGAQEWKPPVDTLAGELLRTIFDLENELASMEQRKDAAYLERNRVVAALAKCFHSGVKKTAIEGWSEDWHGCVYIDLPTGQASWHFHDSQAFLFTGLPRYEGTWDGHSTDEKYDRLAKLKPGEVIHIGARPPAEHLYELPVTWLSPGVDIDAAHRLKAEIEAMPWELSPLANPSFRKEFKEHMERAIATGQSAIRVGMDEHGQIQAEAVDIFVDKADPTQEASPVDNMEAVRAVTEEALRDPQGVFIPGAVWPDPAKMNFNTERRDPFSLIPAGAPKRRKGDKPG